jgi:hypothetical protein
MKVKMIAAILITVWLLLISAFSNAQQLKCGPYTIDKAAFEKALQYEKSHANAEQISSTSTVIRVFFFICEPDGGQLAPIGESDVDKDFQHLIRAYAGDNICFVNAGFNYIYNTALDTFNFSNDNPNIFLPYGIQNCISIFYVDNLGGKNGSSGGGASGITFGPLPTSWTIVEKAYIGKGTAEHEVGHCFGLLHTFDFVNGNGLEDIDGSNGSTSADLIQDTHADPYAYLNEDASSCFTTSNCLYTGTCTDPKGQSNYSPPYTNIMSYWCSGFFPTGSFTPGQYTRVNSFLNTAPVLQVCESPLSITDGPYSISSGFHMNSAVNTLTTSGTTSITNTAMVTLGAGQTVFLEPGFDALPSTGGRIFIRTAFCDTTGSTVLVAEQNENKNGSENSLAAYPNPTNGNLNLDFGLNENQGQVVVQVFDMNLRKVKEQSLGELSSGKQHISINLADLPAALYTIILRSQNVFLSTKVIVTK